MKRTYTARDAMRFFKAESADLVLCSLEAIEAASDIFEKQGDYASANDILSRYDDMQEEMRILMHEFM